MSLTGQSPESLPPSAKQSDSRPIRSPESGTRLAESSTSRSFAGYRIIRSLGSGGTGEVFVARHPRLPRDVALKILKPEFSHNDEFRARFLREADLVAQLSHPAIVDVSDRGEDDGRLWIAMQYIPGADAGRLLREGKVDVRHAVEIILAVADALDYAHSLGIVHRDVKPANILVPQSRGLGPPAYVTDFGVGRRLADETRLTRVDTLVGTVDYTAPERFTDRESGGLGDQYSLGCTAFHLLTGSRPFESDSLATIVAEHRSRHPPSARNLNPQLPWPIDHVLYRAMSKDPANRYASCREFAADLATFLERRVPAPSGHPAANAPARSGASPIPAKAAEPAPRPPGSEPDRAAPTGTDWATRTRIDPEGIGVPTSGVPTSGVPTSGVAPARPVPSPERPTFTWEILMAIALFIIVAAGLTALLLTA